MKNKKIVLMRHGESQWNQLNQFTGWKDVELSEKGKKEALYAAKLLKKNNFFFDIAYTSVLRRAIHTLWILLDQLDQMWIPTHKSWKLNERNYGALEGLNKETTVKKYGSEKVLLWRRSFLISPPNMDNVSHLNLKNERKYKEIEKTKIPASENLEMTLKRVVSYWNSSIVPQIKQNKSVIIVAHGNSLRGLMKYLGNINNKDIMNLDIATGSPLIYEFSNEMKPLKYYYL
ncbi:2,3-diphosphoglycerate-dependent phosphoglycerate mutase [Buchnera aphidicola]|uniref:2,3-bisphosphoglycerate-dependent phosphoglycerate mutase n=1 Tax=Buchnera aphidicola (Cinara strobi) TaxID=1921549 RepID=A0A3B1E0L2_9GAMM|nr:2,3-diphosphoglycerate-dependent phosphoglycerate mutase [Buchnera aphidicola]VAX76545.1 2,3-bisphosphoglycerate-dependent phosphoglycerate mutase [Buchnera aphidicola (Cinara strobi)]